MFEHIPEVGQIASVEAVDETPNKADR